ncbi:MAG: type II toxin-antitoxin system RelE/ParE family toxin [Maricaulis sp.]|jgi:plasmid stabilization system protein ParE|nr:type II toxin-antitoxin system RelE/ParE family toxin [Maricaulis sp.]MDG2043160.1 type II toxin-antitoxin system RelE/ParE family toxin [Maricaulis sp.]
MSRPWRLTRHAAAALTDIANWTYQAFGAAQAESYQNGLITCCRQIASGNMRSRSCARLIAHDCTDNLRYARSGQHYVVFLDAPERVVIVDVLHVRSNLPGKLAQLEQ